MYFCITVIWNSTVNNIQYRLTHFTRAGNIHIISITIKANTFLGFETSCKELDGNTNDCNWNGLSFDNQTGDAHTAY